MSPTTERVCKHCSTPLLLKNFADFSAYKRAKFCSRECYLAQHAKKFVTAICAHCHGKFTVNANAPTKQYCTLKCRYAAQKREGASYIGTNGYRYVKVHDREDQVEGAYELEHRLVMEEHLGRPLLGRESVHHKDGNKLNNAIDNLEILTHAEHMRRHHAEYVATQGYHPVNSAASIAKRTATKRAANRNRNMVLPLQEMHRSDRAESNSVGTLAQSWSNNSSAKKYSVV